MLSTDLPGYSDTVYSDNLSTVTLVPGPKGVTVSGDVCTDEPERRMHLVNISHGLTWCES